MPSNPNEVTIENSDRPHVDACVVAPAGPRRGRRDRPQEPDHGRTPDYTSAERQALTEIQRQRGGAAALMADYVFAQITAGLVKAPTFASAGAKA